MPVVVAIEERETEVMTKIGNIDVDMMMKRLKRGKRDDGAGKSEKRENREKGKSYCLIGTGILHILETETATDTIVGQVTGIVIGIGAGRVIGVIGPAVHEMRFRPSRRCRGRRRRRRGRGGIGRWRMRGGRLPGYEKSALPT